jgi:hypothetical protein
MTDCLKLVRGPYRYINPSWLHGVPRVRVCGKSAGHPGRCKSLEAVFSGRRASLKDAQQRVPENRAFVAQIKLERGCVDCGYKKHAVALDFDHLPGFEKTAAVSNLLSCTRERILAEIAKCEVVCANCHRVRTANRLS